MIVQIDERVGAGPRGANGLVDALRITGHRLRRDHARVAKVDRELEERRVAAYQQVRLRHQVDVAHCRLVAAHEDSIVAEVHYRI